MLRNDVVLVFWKSQGSHVLEWVIRSIPQLTQVCDLIQARASRVHQTRTHFWSHLTLMFTQRLNRIETWLTDVWNVVDLPLTFWFFRILTRFSFPFFRLFYFILNCYFANDFCLEEICRKDRNFGTNTLSFLFIFWYELFWYSFSDILFFVNYFKRAI